MVSALPLDAVLTGKVLHRGKLSSDLLLDASARWEYWVRSGVLTGDLQLNPVLTARTRVRNSAGPQRSDMALLPTLRSFVHVYTGLSADCALLPVLSGGRIYRHVRGLLLADLSLYALLRGVEISTTPAPEGRTFCLPQSARVFWVSCR